MASQTRRRERSRLLMRAAVLATVTTTLVPGSALRAQTDGTCIPVAQRAGRTFGCFITARQELGHLPRDLLPYWHLDTYPIRVAADRARAAEKTS